MVDISGISSLDFLPSSSVTRVVTCLSDNWFVYREDNESGLKGIGIDLWRKTAKDLNLTYQIQVQEWWEMMDTFNNGQADIIVQTMNDDQMAISDSTAG